MPAKGMVQEISERKTARWRRVMKVRCLRTEVWLPVEMDRLFAFFADAHNLDRLTPPWLHFAISTPAPIKMDVGAIIDYRLKWRWLPLRWKTEISHWEPPVRFVDCQIKGPYKKWRHEHTFIAKDRGTLMKDELDYSVPGGFVEPVIHRLLVGPDVRKIFAYRESVIQGLFASDSKRNHECLFR